MAGIGYHINRLLRSDNLFSKLGGISASVFFSSGPWLCTILSIACITSLTSDRLEPMERQLFRIIINYTYAGSLILFSVIEILTTRYMADSIYLRQEKVLPTLYCLISLIVLTTTTIAGSIFYSMSGIGWQITVLATVLLSTVGLIWCSMIFLSACKDYFQIAMSFCLGMACSIGISLVWGMQAKFSLREQLASFALGQMVTVFSLGYRIFKEFGTGYLSPRDYTWFCSQHRLLILVGLFYSSAIWIDKIIFWLGPTGERVAPMFYKSSAYDSGVFVAYLSIVPAMAYFLVTIETKFYSAYRRYFSLIDNKAPLSLIERGRVEIIDVVRQDIWGLIVFQSFVTIPSLVFAPQIMQYLGFSPIHATVFRYGLIAAALHVFLLFTNILILYLDVPKVVAKNYGLFLLMNGLFSYLSAVSDYRYHGVGYALAALIALVGSVTSLNRILEEMNFFVFMKQPLAKPAHKPLEFEWVSLK